MRAEPTSKLKSLPEPLRAAADELLADKFPEPEVEEEEYTTVSQLQFLREPKIASFTAADAEGFNSPVLVDPDPENIIEENSLYKLRELVEYFKQRDINSSYGRGYLVANLQFKFHPAGRFMMPHSNRIDHYEAYHYMQRILSEITLDIELFPGVDNASVESRIMDYMDRLRVRFGGGTFTCILMQHTMEWK